MTAAACAGCGTEIAPALLACPQCRRLVHADRLRQLAASAESAEAGGDLAGATRAWRDALDLLPGQSRQGASIAAKVEELERRMMPPAGRRDAPQAGGAGGRVGRLAGAGAGAIALLLTKGKFLLAGLLKLPTLLTMFAAAGVYWSLWGWRFAVGIVLTTYVHEMGHVAALVRYGVTASPPLFVPGLGAFVRLNQPLKSVGESARVGLAGPLWGLLAGAVCLGVGWATGSPAWLAIAQFTGFVNLFNLLPVWQLDGGRAFEALTRLHRVLALVVLAALWYLTREGLVVLLVLGAGWQLFRPAPEETDPGVLVDYALLATALGGLTLVTVPGTGLP